MQAIRDERDKLLTDLDRLDAGLKVARDIISAALTLLAKPQRLYRAMTDSQRKLLNALLFTKITVDAHGVTGEQLAEPFDALIPLGRYYTQHGTLPASPPAGTAETGTDGHDGPAHDCGQPSPGLAGHSSNKT
ncbi:MAG TPA: hypothetical protein VJT72_07900, partial [Pseudonocardiaceae bacterium]|nr:hypothetical protein [Pseudonocardiaceae bacterium]